MARLRKSTNPKQSSNHSSSTKSKGKNHQKLKKNVFSSHQPINQTLASWFHQFNQKYLAKSILSDAEIETLNQNKVFFGYHKTKGFYLKYPYALGVIAVKRSIAFLLDPLGDDLPIELSKLNGALDGDLCLVRVDGTNPIVVQIIEHQLKHVILNYRVKKGRVLFTSQRYVDRHFEVDQLPSHLTDGAVFEASVTGFTRQTIKTTFKRLIGYANDPGIDVLKLVYQYQWPIEFSEAVYEELTQLLTNQPPAIIRRDLTHTLIVTIDGADAKDLDDAVSLEVLDEGKIQIGVHIADVSFYVKENGALDSAALSRGTSVYLADRVIPMLPPKLSNDLCSLNPDTEKLTLTCQMTLNNQFEVIDYEIFPSRIKTKHRLTYDQVNQLLTTNQSTLDAQTQTMLFKLHEVAQGLKSLRTKRGAIDFESSELKFVINENDQVDDVLIRQTDQAEQLIESLMILANEVVAKHMVLNHLPGIYRVHEKPDITKLSSALELVNHFSFSSTQSTTPKVLSDLINQAKGSKYEPIVHSVLLRSMQKAAYDDQPIGHFGLASKYYSHFTSPIRRYPDLILHRMIHRVVINQPSVKTIQHFKQILPEIAQQTSISERQAISLSRDVEKLKSIQYLERFSQQTYQGIITQTASGGFWVRLTNGIEGFCSLSDMNEYYDYDQTNYTYFGRFGGFFQLADLVVVKLLRTDKVELNINFEVLERLRK